MHARLLALTLAVVAMAGCGDDDPVGPEPARTYEVTFENLTGGQPFTPPLVATHSAAADVFSVGSAASEGVQEVAENGNLTPLQESLEAAGDVSSVVVAVAGDPPPLMPGASVTITIEAEGDADLISFVSMLICTNDGFTGLDSRSLPANVNQEVVYTSGAYDAGTENNTEDFADIVPPCPALTGVTSTDPGTGMSDPALAQNGVIATHQGVSGGVDLLVDPHDWADPVARTTIRRTQ